MDAEDEKTPLELIGINIPDDLKGLFGDPPILQGEQAQPYWGLLAAIIKDRKPQTFAEWIYVHDTISNVWEEQRFKRASTELMRGEKLEAFLYVFTDNVIVSSEEQGKGESPGEKYGITPAVRQARAIQLNSELIQMLETMRTMREKIMTLDAETSAKAERIKQMLIVCQADEAQTMEALEFTYAQLYLLRIRAARKGAIAELDDVAGDLSVCPRTS